MNKKIPTVIAISIVLITAILAGGLILWQYSKINKKDNQLPETNILEKEEATTNPIETEESVNLIYKEFSYPYPFSFTWEEGIRKADFSLISVSLGERTVPSFISFSSYKPGDKINALTLYFKINTHWEDIGLSLPTEFRILVNEEGDMIAPINDRFNVESLRGDRVYSDQEVIFVVPTSQEKFTLTTGGESNIFFEITVDGAGNLNVERNIEEG
ncbi:MAG: hypothetical protein FJZ16_06650 [Candidatus Omnitrophica bacterium]|nr:hypothetical protein [Candidatus Omnitrophota bacterium]